MNNIFAATCTTAALICSYLYFFPSDDSAGRAASTDKALASGGIALSSSHSPSSPRANSMSPFGIGQPPPEDPSARVNRLQKKMEKMGFFTPEKYYKFDLKTLRKMAEGGDVFAIMQLAEQYYSENQGLENDPDYDFATSPKIEANKYLAKAATMGMIRAGTLLSVRYQEEARPIEAYAWKIVSEKLGDKVENLHSGEKVNFATDADTIGQAQHRADDILAALLRNPPPVFPQ